MFELVALVVDSTPMSGILSSLMGSLEHSHASYCEPSVLLKLIFFAYIAYNPTDVP